VFHFEGKIWRTLPLLVWNPGRLTREYIDGRRASYVSPIALFLFVVFLTFGVFNALGSPIDFKTDAPSATTGRLEAEKSITQLENRKAAAEARGQPIAGIDGQIEGAKSARDAWVAIEQGQLPDPIAKQDGMDSAPTDMINTAWRKAKANPQLLIYKLQTSAYKFSWALIPLSVPFMWLLFPFSRRWHLYDHTVFVTYSISFMLLLAAFASLLALANASELLVIAVLCFAPLHMYRQLRGTYDIGRLSAWLRTGLLTLFAQLTLLLFAIAVSTLVATG
jgi:hypothetical protein